MSHPEPRYDIDPQVVLELTQEFLNSGENAANKNIVEGIRSIVRSFVELKKIARELKYDDAEWKAMLLNCCGVENTKKVSHISHNTIEELLKQEMELPWENTQKMITGKSYTYKINMRKIRRICENKQDIRNDM